MTAQLDLSQPMRLSLRVRLEDATSERALARALEALVHATRALPSLLLQDESDVKSMLSASFVGARDELVLSERAFFERTARFAALAPLTLQYVEQLNPALWQEDPFFGAGLWATQEAPAGSHAIVPLALASAAHLPALITHLRGVDLDHETFHRALITELVRVHGLTEPTLELLAFRAVDGAGQDGPQDLAWLRAHSPFGAWLDAPGGLLAFAQRVHERSQRSVEHYRALYVANAGCALVEDAAAHQRWLGAFRDQGLRFHAADEQYAPVALEPPASFEEAWPAAADALD